jgi:hypothetical protein
VLLGLDATLNGHAIVEKPLKANKKKLPLVDHTLFVHALKK